jgi:hypothetical protein
MTPQKLVPIAIVVALLGIGMAPAFGAPPRRAGAAPRQDAVAIAGVHALPPTPPPAVPFGVGEVMSYKMSARWGLLGGGGQTSLRVEAIDTLHGHEAYRLSSHIRAGIAWFKADDLDRSWLDVDELFSRRFSQKHSDGRDRTYEFFPTEMRFVDLANPADSGSLASARPLDDVSFLYHARTLPLAPDSVYVEPRYYKAEGNPVTVQVLRRERVRVPAGEFAAIVVRPIIRSERSLFKEGAQAEIWFSDDALRIPLKLRAKKSVFTLTMELQSYRPGAPARQVLAPSSSATPF